MSRITTASYYALLGVPADASTEVIHAAWRQWMGVAHPDRANGADKPARNAQAVRLNAAWAVLGDPTRRAAYDLELRTNILPVTPMASSFEPPYGSPYAAVYAAAYRTAGRDAVARSSARPSFWTSPTTLQGLGLAAFISAGALLTTFAALPFALPAAVIAGAAGLIALFLGSL